MVKKFLALLLALAICVSLSACGNKEETFKDELYVLANKILEVYYNANHVVEGTRIIWNNVGSDEFWTCYNGVRSINLDLTKQEYDAFLGQNCYALIWGAARGLCPSQIYDKNKMTADAQEATIDLCLDFNESYAYIEENMAVVSEEVRVFRDKYKKSFPSETSTLNDWCIECSLYVDFAIEPSGNYNSYVSTADNFRHNMERFTKEIDAYY